MGQMKFWPKFKPHLWFWLCLSAVASFDVLSAWLKNRYQVTLVDLALPLLTSGLTAAIAGRIFWKKYQTDQLAGLVGAALATFVLSQDFSGRYQAIAPTLRALLPLGELMAYQQLIFGLLFAGLVIALGGLAGRLVSEFVKRRRWPASDLLGGLKILIAVTFLLLAVPVGRAIIVEWSQFFYRPPTLNLQLAEPAAKPDIYYIVLDRYTSQNVLKTQFNFDNQDFITYLNGNGFAVDPAAKDNYPYTTMSVSSTLDANYQTDLVSKFSQSSLQTIEPYHDSVRFAPVVTELKKLGYSYSELGSWYEATNIAPLADHLYQPEGQLTVFGHQLTLNTFAKNELLGSVYGPLVGHGLRLGHFPLLTYSTISEADATTYKLKTLQTLAAQPAGGRFIFAHILVPHDPYYFNADGSLSPTPGSDNLGAPIKRKYVGQVEFINDQMRTIINQINETSHNQAVIVLQSDEGPYPVQLNDQIFDGSQVEGELSTQNMLAWSDQDLQMKYGILAAYHLPGVSAAAIAQGGDSVNIFRLIFNSYFGAQLPYLPRCYYAYTSGRGESFVYADVTARLTGAANPACSANSNFAH